MFHMLTCFDLKPGVDLPTFEAALAKYAEHLQSRQLLAAVSPVGTRARNTILDTDEGRSQSHFFLMQFANRRQADAATALIESGEKEPDHIHRAMYARADNMVFLCWEDSVGEDPQGTAEEGEAARP